VNLVHANICQAFAKFTLKLPEIQEKPLGSLQSSSRPPNWTSRGGTGKDERERERKGKG